nr:hypothetical protein [Tanacetum cinerariifolium]
MTCHPPIRPAATCTVPRIQLLAASRRHVAASYWTAASDVAPTSAPVNAIDQRRRSTMVNAAGHRSTATDHGGDRRSTVAVNDGRRWRTTVDCRWTTVDHHRSTVVGKQSMLDMGRVWIGSGPGLDQVWAGSGSGPGRVCHMACHVSATCAHLLATAISSNGCQEKKRSLENLEEVFVKENVVVDGMHRNLVPLPGIKGRQWLVIREPKSRIFSIMGFRTWSFKGKKNSIWPLQLN